MTAKTPFEVIEPRVLVRCDNCKRVQPNRRSRADVAVFGWKHAAIGCLMCGHLYGTYV